MRFSAVPPIADDNKWQGREDLLRLLGFAAQVLLSQLMVALITRNQPRYVPCRSSAWTWNFMAVVELPPSFPCSRRVQKVEKRKEFALNLVHRYLQRTVSVGSPALVAAAGAGWVAELGR